MGCQIVYLKWRFFFYLTFDYIYTVSKKSFLICFWKRKTSLNTGDVVEAGWIPLVRRGLFIMPLTLTEKIFNNFQEKEVSGETLKQKFPLFTTTKVRIFVWEFLLKLHFIGIYWKLVNKGYFHNIQRQVVKDFWDPVYEKSIETDA